MVYLQAEGSILVASSPEILCRLDHDRMVTNRYVKHVSIGASPAVDAGPACTVVTNRCNALSMSASEQYVLVALTPVVMLKPSVNAVDCKSCC